MSTVSRVVTVLFFAATSLFAREAIDGFRVASPPQAVQMRVQVLYPGGATLFDSDWKNGNIFDWSAADLPYGSYRLRIFSRDLEGRVTEKQTTLQVSADRISIDPPLPDELTLTTTAHDGTTGELITTSGDLSFRFGDYLHRKDTEAMRLSPEGNLDIKGWIRPAGGILFPDGSVLTTAGSFIDESGRRRSADKKLTPKPEATGTGTMNQIAKWMDSAGTLGDSTVTESGGNLGIGTIAPTGKLHIFGPATLDVFAGMGVDMIAGPAFNFGYGGASFGRSAGFFNVRPDASATPPNPSLRFMTANVQRMIVTNTGDVGIGTTTPSGRFHIFAAPTADVFAGIGMDMIAGPSFNLGYGGATFGRGAGFINVRPDAMATPPNPSLRFMTANVQRMIVTNTGDVGIGTSSPTQKLDVAGNLALPSTASGGTAGVIMLDGDRFAHIFGQANTFVGVNAGNFTMTGNGGNTGIGREALLLNTTGAGNIAVGEIALVANTTGNFNTAAGHQAAVGNISGSHNTAIGAFALNANAGGANNTAIGEAANANNIAGSNNMASGVAAALNTTGDNNTAIGTMALEFNTTGNGNIALGSAAGQNLTTGSNNIDIGNSGVAAEANTMRIGSGNQTRAFIAGIRGVTPAVADGQGVLIDSDGQLGTIGNVSFSNNVALPATASGGTAGVITIGGVRFVHGFGTSNTFVGPNAGNFTMSGSFNAAFGSNVFLSNTTGCCNTAMGHIALGSNTIGVENTAIAYNALALNTSGIGNTGTGIQALFNNTTGSNNTATGRNVLLNNTTGSNNVAIGSNAGLNLTTGNSNIDIDNMGVAAESGTIRIGTTGTHTSAFIAGISGVTTGGAAVAVLVDAAGQLGTTSSSRRYKFDIADMRDVSDGLMRLRPVTFRYLAHRDHAPLQYGLIAEEVAEVYPELVTRDKDGQPETVMYQFLAPMLLNEVQRQRQENAALRARLERLEKIVQKLSGETN